MLNFGAKLNSVLEHVRENHDPYVRLANNAMSAGAKSVPFYHLEELREASFQSDHACEMIVKTLLPKLSCADVAAACSTATAVTINKALVIFRVLYLEGAGGIRMRMAEARGNLHRIQSMQGVRAETLEASNRELATALLQAMEGNNEPLVTLSTVYAGGSIDSVSAPPRQQKSEFQVMHEKEQQMYRKQCEEKKRRSEVIVHERVYSTFDGGLSPGKLVEQVLISPKKRFLKEELDSFVRAAVATGKVQEVCAGLEQHLQDGRQSLQNRFKILLMIEALVNSGVAEACEYYREHTASIRHHLQLNYTDYAVKAEAAMKTASRILQMLQGQSQMPLSPGMREPLPPSAVAPKQWGDAPHQSVSFSIDDLFSDLSVRGTVARPSSSSPTTSSPQPGVSAAAADMFGITPLSQTPLPRSEGSSGGITALSPVPGPSQQFSWQLHPQRDCVPFNVSGAGGAPQQHGAFFPQTGDSDKMFRREEVGPASLDCVSQMYLTTATNNGDKMQLMQQLQAQMESTRVMLEQQQAAFLALQAELNKK